MPEFSIATSVILAYDDQVVDGKLLFEWLTNLRSSTAYHLSIYRKTNSTQSSQRSSLLK